MWCCPGMCGPCGACPAAVPPDQVPSSSPCLPAHHSLRLGLDVPLFNRLADAGVRSSLLDVQVGRWVGGWVGGREGWGESTVELWVVSCSV